ncbi:MAG: glycosyltransferase [Oscillospiraceae bacterium]|nr:glycosyltransferase [Oscillospiraceae bacterium]
MRIIQICEAVDYGDGVGRDIINKHNLLIKMGYDAAVYSRYIHPELTDRVSSFSRIKTSPQDILLIHFAGKSTIINRAIRLAGRKALVYHNITPAEFFAGQSEMYSFCQKGILQLQKAIPAFDCFLADSEYNKADLLSLGAKDADVLPIMIDFDAINGTPVRDGIVKSLERSDTFLFVGRVVPNKKHENIIDVFDYYHKNINPDAKLIFVGASVVSPSYSAMLRKKVSDLSLGSSVFFTGKVSESDLYSYYRAAKVFLCMSEHEGFCIPLLEAMNFGLPVIALDKAAVGYTMGDAGVLLETTEPSVIAEIAYSLIHDKSMRDSVVQKQYERIEVFKESSIERQLSGLIKKFTAKE